MFDVAWVRFATSGTLIGLYGLVDWVAGRRGVAPSAFRPPRWIHVSIVVSVLLFYSLIGPHGSAIAGGWGNLLGVAVALAAMVLRFRVRHGSPRIRHPAVAVRMLFYTALPLAVGAPLGWLALTVPAVLLSAYRSVSEERALGEPRARIAPRYRWIPGVW